MSSTRSVRFKPGSNIAPCPKCENKTDFVINSQQVCEDLCEVWVACKCGHETPPDHRLEDVWGSLGYDNVVAAISCWNDAINDH